MESETNCVDADAFLAEEKRRNFELKTKRMSELIWAAAFAYVAWDWMANTIEFRGTVAAEAADSMVATYLAYRATVPK